MDRWMTAKKLLKNLGVTARLGKVQRCCECCRCIRIQMP